MDETTLRFIAQQLRQPSGEPGREVGERMNVGNAHVNLAAIAALRVAPHDRILEVGMGNGAFVPLILGIDSSVRYVGCECAARRDFFGQRTRFGLESVRFQWKSPGDLSLQT